MTCDKRMSFYGRMGNNVAGMEQKRTSTFSIASMVAKQNVDMSSRLLIDMAFHFTELIHNAAMQ